MPSGPIRDASVLIRDCFWNVMERLREIENDYVDRQEDERVLSHSLPLAG
jgi:hypothetical protein